MADFKKICLSQKQAYDKRKLDAFTYFAITIKLKIYFQETYLSQQL